MRRNVAVMGRKQRVENVPAGALALSVAPQRNTEGWTLEKRPGTSSADAAFKSSLNTSASE